MNNRSPRPIRWLEAILPSDLYHLLGDLEEEYHRNCGRLSSSRASLLLYSQILRSLPWLLGIILKWNLIMIAHYLKTALRITRKHLGFSFINVAGLAASMAVCLLILLFLVDQKSYDQFHEHSDRIYRVITDLKSPSNNSSSLYATSPASLGGLLEESYPEVEKSVTLRSGFRGEIRYGETYLSLEGMYTEPAFFSMLDFELLKGNPETALQEPGSIILSPESAAKLFGDSDPMGKQIEALGDRTYTVTGIIDTDVRSHLPLESLVSWSTLTSQADQRERLANWRSSIYTSYTYLLLKENSADTFSSKLAEVHETFPPGEETVITSFHLQPITGINLSSIKYNELGMILPGFILWFLLGFSAVIILIACFNYVSLTIARAVNRNGEVGVRKVLGAYRSSILKQFLTESVLVSLLAMFFSLFLLNWLLPQFNSLFLINFTESQIAVDLFKDYWVYGLFLACSVTIGILAGFYPAWRFTSVETSRVLKGAGRDGKSRFRLRKIITVTQFTVSIVFIITSLVLYQQFRFMSEADYGFDHERVIHVALQDVPFEQFEQVLGNTPAVASMAATSMVPALSSVSSVVLNRDSLSPEVRAHHFWVNPGYINTMRLNLLSGRNFNSDLASDTTQSVILGRSAVAELGWGTPADAVGQPVDIYDQSHRVIGVIDDFISNDPTQTGDPIVLRYHPDRALYAVVKVHQGGIDPFLSELKRSWAGFGSIYILKYDVFDNQLRNNPTLVIFRDFLKILGMVAFFSVFISCLGLLGMAMYKAENRVKEIGIRKVLGASRKQIILLLSREYLVLILLAVLIGAPLAWGINSLWLSALSNSISLGPLIFVAGIAGTAALALVTITSQTLRAARTSVVENLKSE